jgi:ATP-binding cassette, subfamily B, beta-glucan exporter
MSFLQIYGRVLAMLRTEKRSVAILVVAAIAMVTTQFAEPVLLGRLINTLSPGAKGGHLPSLDALMPTILAWIGFALASIAAAVVVSLLADRLAHRRRLAVMASFFEHALELPLAFHTATHSGRSLKIMLDSATGMFVTYLSLFRENLAALLSLIVILPVSLWFNWRLGLLLVALIVLVGSVATFVRRRTETLQRHVEFYNTSLAERASDVLGNVPVIQSFTSIDAELAAMRSLSRSLLAAQMPVLTWWAAAGVFSRAASTITLLAIFVFGTVLYLHGIGTIGGIVMFMSFATMLIGRLEQLSNFSNSLFLQAEKLGDFFRVLDTVPQVAAKPGAPDPGKLKGRVVFEDVTFSYPPSEGSKPDGRPTRPAVEHLDIVAEPGDTIALVGATGSGKSTTLALLHRAFDPEQGRLTIDGIDIRDMPLVALRRNIGVVFQEPMLFARSIEENLRIGKPNATAEEVQRALELAQAADFVARQPQGLATSVGERGRSLSGGERQRLAIARALLKDPPIMIFDEATAALDAATEQKLQLALASATAGRTTFVIAHRLATIRNATRILLLDHGKVLEQGSFEELVAANGRFAALARAQFMTRKQEVDAVPDSVSAA